MHDEGLPDAMAAMLLTGHGGIDNGTKGAGEELEKDIVLAFALTLREKLEAAGHGGGQHQEAREDVDHQVAHAGAEGLLRTARPDLEDG